MDFSKDFMNYELQNASSKNIMFHFILLQYRKNMLMFFVIYTWLT